MYVFSRRRRIDPGQLRAALGFSTDIAHRVTQITGVDVVTYLSTMSRDVGTVLWGAVLPDLQSLEAAFDKLMAESTYVEAVERANGLFITPLEDTVSQIVHGEIGTDTRPEYVTVVQGTCAPGSLAQAMAAGVEIAQQVTTITGLQTLFLSEVTNEFGAVSWGAPASSIQEVQRANEALAADAGWIELLDRHGSVFAPGSTTTLFRRIG